MVLKLENGSKQFLRQRKGSNVFYAVEDVSVSFRSGEIAALYGRSGSGKSTMLNMLAGILTPTEGKVYLGDTDVYAMPDAQLSRFRNRHFGVIPQEQTAIHSLTVLENVMLPCTLYKCAKEEQAQAEQRARALLERTGIGDLADVMPSELSGGEIRRMAIARALIRDPDAILADEPTADLDEENTRVVLRLLREAADEGKIVFTVTHDKEVIDYANVVYHMEKGHLTEGE